MCQSIHRSILHFHDFDQESSGREMELWNRFVHACNCVHAYICVELCIYYCLCLCLLAQLLESFLKWRCMSICMLPGLSLENACKINPPLHVSREQLTVFSDRSCRAGHQQQQQFADSPPTQNHHRDMDMASALNFSRCRGLAYCFWYMDGVMTHGTTQKWYAQDNGT